MKILNKSKKCIDGIAPLKVVDVDEKHALKLKAMYGSEIEIVEENKKAEILKTEHKNLKAMVSKLEKENKELSEYNDELEKDNAENEKVNAELRSEVTTLKSDLIELINENKELKDGNKKEEVPAPPAPPEAPKNKKK